MPLLGKNEFCLNTLPEGLSMNDRVFFCKTTGEAFLTYDEFFSRQMMYDSLIWTCSVTGKSTMTYLEALKSEKESQTLVSSIPKLLQKVLLHLMNYQNNFSTNVTISLLLEYTNLRYFIGENVLVSSKNRSKRTNAVIRDVIPPQIYESSNTISYGIDPLAYNYLVELVEENKTTEIVPASRISRSKCLLTREKIRLLLKKHLAPKNGRYDTLSVKPESIKKFGLANLKWEDIFKGPTPNFEDDTFVVKACQRYHRFSEELASTSNYNESVEENSNDSKMDQEKTVQLLKKKSNLLSSQKMKLIKREEKYLHDKKKNKKSLKNKDKLKKLKPRGKPGPKPKKKNEEEIDDSLVNKVENKNREKESRKQYEEDLKTWMEKRDDLLCDDLKPLPELIPICCDIPDDLIGDCLVIIDFLNVYRDYILFNDNFPRVISFGYFLQILKDKNVPVNGFGDLLIALLNSIFDRDDIEIEPMINETNNDDLEINGINLDDEEIQIPPNNSNYWVSTYFSSREHLSKLRLDPFTLSEILRLYILKARNLDGKRIRKIRPNDINLTQKLSIGSVFDLNQYDRVKIIEILLNDLVKVPSVRLKIEASMEEMFMLKTQIRRLNASYTKWLRENPIRQRLRKKKSNDTDENQSAQDPETEATPEEKEQYKKDKAQKEQEMKQEIAELKARIRKLSAFCRSRPVGLDRNYRKYWIFESIPGLFVEHSIEKELSYPCFENPVPQSKPELADYMPDTERGRKKPKEEAVGTKTESSDNFLDCNRCSGNSSTCLVHASNDRCQRMRWGFYTKDQFESLMESLNSRGFRENELKNSFSIEKQTILTDYLDNFDPLMFNKYYVAPKKEESEENNSEHNIRKSERIKISNKKLLKEFQEATISPNEALYIEFQAQLLLSEDNIFNACFSSFSLEDRDEWYKDMYNTYQNKLESLSLLTRKFYLLSKSVKPFCILGPLSIPYPESVTSPSEKENIGNNHAIKFPQLSKNWMDVLKVPEGLSEDNLYSNDYESSYGITTFSQLFVNLYLLEKSLNWNMSASKTAAKCGVCRKKAGDEPIILCDKCNGGFHVECLDPPVVSVDPKEDWFCHLCLPKLDNTRTGHGTIGRKNDIKKQENPPIQNGCINNEVNDVDKIRDCGIFDRCKSCNKSIYEPFSEVFCKTCGECFHLKCVNLIRQPRSWNCLSCHTKERYVQQYGNTSSDNEKGELRRSQRKRKPNHYLDFEPNDENFSANMKARRCVENENNNQEFHKRIIVK